MPNLWNSTRLPLSTSYPVKKGMKGWAAVLMNEILFADWPFARILAKAIDPSGHIFSNLTDYEWNGGGFCTNG